MRKEVRVDRNVALDLRAFKHDRGVGVPMGLEGMWAFIDEFGNPNLEVEKEGASLTFIVAAVLVKGPEVETLRTELEVIRKRFFQTGEMRSKLLAGDMGRWKRLLLEVAPLPFKFGSSGGSVGVPHDWSEGVGPRSPS